MQSFMHLSLCLESCVHLSNRSSSPNFVFIEGMVKGGLDSETMMEASFITLVHIYIIQSFSQDSIPLRSL